MQMFVRYTEMQQTPNAARIDYMPHSSAGEIAAGARRIVNEHTTSERSPLSNCES